MAEPNVIEPLRSHIVDIDTVKPWPGNPNQGDIDDVADSMQAYGQWRIAIVQKSSGQICIGNTMWIAAKERLGWTGIAAAVVDLSDDEAKRMLARDNRSRDKATYNEYLLADFLAELADTDEGLDGTGFEMVDLDELLKTTGTMAATTTEFLEQFTPAPADAPSLHPFSDATAPAVTTPAAAPQNPGQAPAFPAQAAAVHPDSGGDVEAAPTVTGTPSTVGAPPSYGPGVHTGPGAYSGPGAPAPAGDGPGLPQRADLTPMQWVVSVDQRETIRAALRTAQSREGLDNGAAALTAVCAHYLTATTFDAAADTTGDDTGDA